ncbi:MAG: hypothetical protein GKR89_04500 [Candidatus Latescibacteria bacterium]|nr:hypothetical protein [Candidatus Latescibacterota bacterium]
MTIDKYAGLIALLVIISTLRSDGLGDTRSRAMGLTQSYTALAVGPEAVFWNPANLALRSSPAFSWDLLGMGLAVVGENNSISVDTYNKNFTKRDRLIDDGDKKDLVGDIEGGGLRVNVDIEPVLSFFVPLNGGVAFSVGEQYRAALALGLTAGAEGEMPKDMVELVLFGNEFDRPYDIAEWDGSGWAIGTVNGALARAWMPATLEPHLSEFTVGANIKMIMGAYGQIERSNGGFISRAEGADLEAYAIANSAGIEQPGIGGLGFGLDLGVAGVTKGGTTFSVGLLNLLDTISWSGESRQDSLFATAEDLRVTRFLEGVPAIEEVLDNEDVDGDGDKDFHKKVGSNSFSRSMPALLRVGVARQWNPKVLAVANWDQAFTSGFGYSTTPRVSAGMEYRLVDWFPARLGLSVGGRGNSSSVGFGFGPFNFSNIQLELMDFAWVARGGFFPGLSKGAAISLTVFKLNML